MMDRLFDDAFFAPAWSWFDSRRPISGSNLYETPQAYILQIALPGAKPESITVNVQQHLLTVEGESALTAPEGATTIWRSFGDQIRYEVELPNEVESKEAKATYEAGILTIDLPKAAHVRPQAIKVLAK
jgi:HSP20 family protein